MWIEERAGFRRVFIWSEVFLNGNPTIARFLTLEGGEGAGKSTQIKRLHARLRLVGIDAVTTREPGGSPGAERIRALILEAGAERFDPLTEALLFSAARHDHLAHLIRPALAQGRWVLCDRFSDSTRVYQGMTGAVSSADLEALDRLVVASTQPDLTLILDLEAHEGLRRAQLRRGAALADGFESESLAFHESLREGYLALAAKEPARIMVIDASGSEDDVHARIWSVVAARFLANLEI